VKIDIFCHIFPRAFFDRMNAIRDKSSFMQKRVGGIPALVDLDVRFRMMDLFPDYVQIPSLPAPTVESLGDPHRTPELAELANDGLAELVAKYPERFAGFVAALPMNNPDASVKEIERAMTKLGACGVQIYTNVNGRPLDEPDFLPIFGRTRRADLGASRAFGEFFRLLDRAKIEVRAVVGLRLALRDQYLHGSHSFRGLFRSLP
jgi:aminocarboxymuconate-semialdehyde decarboxylase